MIHLIEQCYVIWMQQTVALKRLRNILFMPLFCFEKSIWSSFIQGPYLSKMNLWMQNTTVYKYEAGGPNSSSLIFLKFLESSVWIGLKIPETEHWQRVLKFCQRVLRAGTELQLQCWVSHICHKAHPYHPETRECWCQPSIGWMRAKARDKL